MVVIIKLVIFKIALSTIFSISVKVFTINPTIIRYWIKYAIFETLSLPKFSIIDFKTLCITITIKIETIEVIPVFNSSPKSSTIHPHIPSISIVPSIDVLNISVTFISGKVLDTYFSDSVKNPETPVLSIWESIISLFA